MPIGNAISGVFGVINANKSIAAQKEENQKTREYNLSLAKLQNQWNIDQWQRENQYNSPAAQMARFKAAGLNPDLIYGQSNTGGQISGSLTSGSPANPADIGSLLESRGQHLANSVNITAQRMANAQIENIKADTSNKRSEGEILKTDANFRQALNQGQLDLNSAQINGINATIAKTNAETREIRLKCVNLQHESKLLIAKYDEIRSNISSIDAATAYTKLRGVLESQESKVYIQKLAAETRLSVATTKSIISKLPYELLGLQTSAQLTVQEIDNLKKLGIQYDAQTQTMQFDLNQAKDFDDWERASKVWMFIINGLSSLASPIGIALGGASPKKIKGFGK